MSIFNFFNKHKPHWLTLPNPDESLSFFETIKKESEILWADTYPNKKIYGFQIQQDSKWRKGLTDTELHDFENTFGFTFPSPLRNFYKIMNGLTKKGINLLGSDGSPFTYRSVFYSYPDDVQLIQELIDWIYKAKSLNVQDIESLKISRIFPVYGHRFMLIDIPGNPILSMYGDDIIYYSDNLSKLLVNEIFAGEVHNNYDFENIWKSHSEIKFWLD